MPGFTSQDDMTSEMTAGKRLIIPFAKFPTTNPTAATWNFLWPAGGDHGQGALFTGTALNFVRTGDLVNGALPHGGNVSPDTKHLIYVNAMASAGATPPTLLLVDMVGYYPLTQSASPQNFVNTLGPDRYNVSGTTGGLQVALVTGAGGGATASNLTVLTYVNSNGVTGRVIQTTPTNVVLVSSVLPTATLGARALVTTGAGPWLPLQAGDTGVSQLTNITFSAGNTGLEALVLCKPLATIPLPTALTYGERDLVNQIAGLERIYDGACLCWWAWFPVATGCNFTGEIQVAWG